MSVGAVPRTIEWLGGLEGHVVMIDQTRLPAELVMLECRDVQTMWHAIKRLSIRGAPAIGIAAAMGAVLGVRDYDGLDREGFLKKLDDVCEYLASSRPTAVNLRWALDRLRRCASVSTSPRDSRVPRLTPGHDPAAYKVDSRPDSRVRPLTQALLEEAKRIRDEDEAMCRAIGCLGEPLIRPGCGVLTHCNAGGLATACWGTALAPLYVAHALGRSFHVFVDETRPLLQGSRLTVWELQQAGIGVTLLCDGMVGSLLKSGLVDLVITGADRIAANGGTANKIGTYAIAVLAKAHEIPFYVAAPSSTFDLATPDGSGIPIEERDADEIRRGFGPLTAPPDVDCYCPAFDVTPAALIRGIITERRIIQPVTAARIASTLRV